MGLGRVTAHQSTRNSTHEQLNSAWAVSGDASLSLGKLFLRVFPPPELQWFNIRFEFDSIRIRSTQGHRAPLT